MALPIERDHPFDPPRLLRDISSARPLHRLRYPDGHIGWLVTGYSASRAVLADPRFSTRADCKRTPIPRPSAEPFFGSAALPGWFVDMDPPAHSRYRKTLAGYFTVRRVAALAPRIAQIVAQRLDVVAAQGPPTDLVASFAGVVPALVVCEVLGIPLTELADFQRHTAPVFSLASSAAESESALRALGERITELFRWWRRRPAAGLLSELTSSDLTDEELTGIGVFLFTAAHETVAGMIALGSFALLTNPAQLAALRTDWSAMDNAVEELLRYLTVFQFGVPRTPLADVAVEGTLLTAGESVTVSLPAANRDPARFACPDQLDLARPTAGHLAFGHGLHLCIGQHLARIELRIALAALFRRFPGLCLAVPPAQVPLATHTGFYGLRRLPVTW